MMFLIYFIDKKKGEYRFLSDDIEYVKFAFDLFMKDDDIIYVSLEILEVKK